MNVVVCVKQVPDPNSAGQLDPATNRLKREQFDLVVAATESTDGYTGVVPQMIAELLGVPSVTFAKHVEADGTTLKVNRQTEAGYDVVEADLPAVLTVTAGAFEPRYPSLKGIMAAKSKPVDRLTAADLGLDNPTPGEQVVSVQPAEERKSGEIVEDDGTAAQRIVDFLAAQKVI